MTNPTPNEVCGVGDKSKCAVDVHDIAGHR